MLLNLFAWFLGAIALVVGLYLLVLEGLYRRRRPANRLEMSFGTWQLTAKEPTFYQIMGEVEALNPSSVSEVMVPEIAAEVKLLSNASTDGITTTAKVVALHSDATSRPDNYWFAYIVKSRSYTKLKVIVEISGQGLADLQVAWVRLHYVTYGTQGRIPKVRDVVFPFCYPAVEESKNWRSTSNADVLPIKTHLLTPLDNPIQVVKRYVVPHAQPGDVVTIGESPIAIMQGRFVHPSMVQPGWAAKRLCHLFLPTSSLATACGMQSLIDMVGPVRVLWAFGIGAIAKALFRRPGVFYQLAGEQARLVDDVTGTLPPYDQFIVFGPEDSQRVVNEIQAATGLGAAIVDVNDLGAVKVLAATADVALPLLKTALAKNPAGNADEQTPVVLIRPGNR